MKSQAWGKLIARLAGFLLVHEGVDNFLSLWLGWSDSYGDGLSVLPKYLPLVSVIAGVSLWLFAPLLVPAEHIDASPDDPSKVGATLVAGMGTYFFLAYAYSFVSLFLTRGSSESGPEEVSHLSLWFELAVCIGFALCVVNARRIASWVAR